MKCVMQKFEIQNLMKFIYVLQSLSSERSSFFVNSHVKHIFNVIRSKIFEWYFAYI